MSKLLLIHAIRFWTQEHPVPTTNVVMNFVNPGLCITELDRNVNDSTRAQLKKFRDEIGRTAEMGSRTLVHGLFGGESTHGAYTSECVAKDHYTPGLIAGEEGQKMGKLVWESVRKHVNEVVPGTL